MSSGHDDIARADRIMELCRSAHAKGWEFSQFRPSGYGASCWVKEKKQPCGCALQACASELGARTWFEAAHSLGVNSDQFGAGFDGGILGDPQGSDNKDALLGRLIALRLKQEGLA